MTKKRDEEAAAQDQKRYKYKYRLLQVLGLLHEYHSGSFPEAFTPAQAAERMQWVQWRVDNWEQPTGPVERCIHAFAVSVLATYGVKSTVSAPATTYEATDLAVVKRLEDDFPDPASNRPPTRSTRTG